MTLQARVIYENGQLCVDDVKLEAGQEVYLTIEPIAEDDLFRRVFADSVIMPDLSDDSDAGLENELDAIAEAFSGGKCLSDMIIEDRGEL